MKPVARFLHAVGGIKIGEILDPRQIPRIGSPLFAENDRKVGIVTDVIGNVKHPYLVIKGDRAEVYYTKEKFLLRGDING